MNILLKIFLLLGLFLSSISANTEARKVSLYFANGMFGDSKQSEKTTWKTYVDTLKASNPNINQAAAPKVAYNSNFLWEPDNAMLLKLAQIVSGADGILEVMFQKFAGDTISWAKTQDYLQSYIVGNEILEAANVLSQSFNIEDLTTHIKSYKKALNDGHIVIVTAHS